MISLHDGKGTRTRKVPEKALTLKLTVVGATPVIWRRMVVRETMWLSRLHDAIQVAFDWFDYQTHAFALDELRFGNPFKDDDRLVEDDRDVALADLDLANRERLTYEYQFGEGWQVEVRIEKVALVEKGAHYPVCVAGSRAGPPEDCGGLEAFHDMLSCLKEPETDLGREWIEWLGPEYDAATFDMEKVNRALKRLGR